MSSTEIELAFQEKLVKTVYYVKDTVEEFKVNIERYFERHPEALVAIGAVVGATLTLAAELLRAKIDILFERDN